ncbi:hypothetical protein N657DRAFT_691474 [Parathielavia appendiculata]|uniref:Uncharacterized protein n=1 Tax=Parathielavia appendiculata TaxID=2587402 RepID=A0AAN6Z305_9PEZI|nr:hypothetical protein N657DRAFT_691474 [Parathielavia appendiculata]
MAREEHARYEYPVDIENNTPVSEILVPNFVPKPDKPNPLALFPNPLEKLPSEALEKVAVPVLDEKGDAVQPRQYTSIRNQAIEDDALVHLTSAQAAGWRARRKMYHHREAQRRTQRKNILAIRRWIHIDPVLLYQKSRAMSEFLDRGRMAGAPGLKVNDWFRQWVSGIRQHTTT